MGRDDMDHPCPYNGCTHTAKSEKALSIHYTLDHEAYDQNTPIRPKALEDIQKMKDMVRFCLIRFPATRSDDQLLYQKILQYFYPYTIRYVKDSEFPIQPVNGIGWDFRTWCMFPNQKVVARRRAELQRRYPELQANYQTTIEREIKESAEHGHYAMREII